MSRSDLHSARCIECARLYLIGEQGGRQPPRANGQMWRREAVECEAFLLPTDDLSRTHLCAEFRSVRN